MIYLISFDPHKVDGSKLHHIIEHELPISTWWHYLGSTYLIKTDSSFSEVKDAIHAKWPKQRFLIIKVDPSQYSGWLPPKAWAWIKRNK